MSMNVGMHEGWSLESDPDLIIVTEVTPLLSMSSPHDEKFVKVDITCGDSGMMSLFIHHLSTVDHLASTFEALARELREAHGWGAVSDTDITGPGFTEPALIPADNNPPF